MLHTKNNKRFHLSRLRSLLGLGPPVPLPDIMSCPTTDVPTVPVPNWMQDDITKSNRLNANYDIVRAPYTSGAIVLPTKWDERLEIVALQNMALQAEYFGPEFVKSSNESRDLWMCDHWHFPFLFMVSMYNVIGFWFLDAVDTYGLPASYRDYAMPFVIFLSMIVAWFLDFLWELLEEIGFDIVIYFFPLASFSNWFGRETRTNSVVIDPLTGFFGIIAATCTIMISGYQPQFPLWSANFWVQMIVLLVVLMASGCSLFALGLCSLIECACIFLIYYVWFQANWLFVTLWCTSLLIMAVVVSLGSRQMHNTWFSEPLYSFISIGIPLHALYVSATWIVSKLD